MKEIELRDDVFVSYQEINDGEAICLTEEFQGEVTDQIILIRPLALRFAKTILELMGSDEQKK